MNLQFGLNRAVPGTVRTVWGARFIFPDDILPDRQSIERHPEADPKDETALLQWLNNGPLKQARYNTRRAAYDLNIISENSSEEVILYQDVIGVIVASPNASYGYLYVAAWLHHGKPELQPLPGYKLLPGAQATTVCPWPREGKN